jgi:hypothetical protein
MALQVVLYGVRAYGKIKSFMRKIGPRRDELPGGYGKLYREELQNLCL